MHINSHHFMQLKYHRSRGFIHVFDVIKIESDLHVIMCVMCWDRIHNSPLEELQYNYFHNFYIVNGVALLNSVHKVLYFWYISPGFLEFCLICNKKLRQTLMIMLRYYQQVINRCCTLTRAFPGQCSDCPWIYPADKLLVVKKFGLIFYHMQFVSYTPPNFSYNCAAINVTWENEQALSCKHIPLEIYNTVMCKEIFHKN